MRRQTIGWILLVLAIVLSVYGGYSMIYSNANHKDIPVLGLVFFIVGISLLLLLTVLIIISLFQRKAASKKKETKVEEEKVIEPKPEPETVKEEEASEVEYVSQRETSYEPRRTVPRFNGGSGFVRKVGYGAVLRVSDEEILDMRDNTYYRIEGNIVHRCGSGPVFEISGSSIKLAFGGYLYEISGSSVNKIYGGFYASFSGGYLQTYDLSDKYEVPSDLNLKQKLAVVALLFGTY